MYENTVKKSIITNMASVRNANHIENTPPLRRQEFVFIGSLQLSRIAVTRYPATDCLPRERCIAVGLYDII
jgi:hypothetical protein